MNSGKTVERQLVFVTKPYQYLFCFNNQNSMMAVSRQEIFPTTIGSLEPRKIFLLAMTVDLQ